MTVGSRNSFYLIVSGVISFALHVLLFLLLRQVAIPPMKAIAARDARTVKPLLVQTVDIRDRVFDRQAENKDAADRLQFKAALAAKKISGIFEKENLVPKPAPEVNVTGLGKNVLAPKLPELPPPVAVAPDPPKILEIDRQTLSPERLTAARELTAKKERRELTGDQIPGLVTGDGSGSGGGRGESIGLSMRLAAPPAVPLRAGEIPENDPNRRAAITSLTPSAGGNPLDQALRGQDTGRGAGRLDELVTISLAAFDHPDGTIYFRFDIAPNTRSDKLRAIPKDILFVIDCSTSIVPSKLDQFKAGIVAASEYLTPQDRFNVVSFRTTPDAFFQGYQPVTPETLAAARNYVSRLERGGLTDVYAGINPFFTATPDVPGRPLNVFLLTDGKSTVSTRLDNDVFIRQAAQMRQPHVSLYAFSAGADANRFLMDLLAYSNRGASLHEQKLPDFAPTLARFISDHSVMIVADLRYTATGDAAREIYPKHLPHLYRNDVLHIYGSCPKDTATVGMQLLGRDASGQEQELVFQGNLQSAPRENAEIARNWASQKVFHLLTERVLTPQRDTAAEIRRLGKEFSLYVPYL